jgi:hypothetical protein
MPQSHVSNEKRLTLAMNVSQIYGQQSVRHIDLRQTSWRLHVQSMAPKNPPPSPPPPYAV